MNAVAGVRTSTLGWLLVGPMVCDSVTEFAIGTVVAGAFSYLPDIEHEQSTLGKAVGKVPSRAVRKIAGGHRILTHSFASAVAAALLVWWVADSHLFGLGLKWLPQALLADLLAWNWSGMPQHLMVFLGLVHYAAWAALTGVLAHIWCDLLTVQGVALFAPLSKRKVRLGDIRTGSRHEEFYTAAVNVAAALVVAYHLLDYSKEVFGA